MAFASIYVEERFRFSAGVELEFGWRDVEFLKIELDEGSGRIYFSPVSHRRRDARRLQRWVTGRAITCRHAVQWIRRNGGRSPSYELRRDQVGRVFLQVHKTGGPRKGPPAR